MGNNKEAEKKEFGGFRSENSKKKVRSDSLMETVKQMTVKGVFRYFHSANLC